MAVPVFGWANNDPAKSWRKLAQPNLAAGPVLYFSSTLLHENACAYLLDWALMSYNPKITIHEHP